jgi:FkbM family methyltransferase
MKTQNAKRLLYPLLRIIERTRAVIGRQIWKIKLRVYAPKINASKHNLKLLKLGTQYGGWTFVDLPELNGASIISGGLGQDASFDVEFAAHYNARVIVVDPTPSAIAHFHSIVDHLGQKSSTPYNKSGQLPITSYDLSGVRSENFSYCPKALWTENTSLRFYSPPLESDVSYSISNFSNEYKQDGHYIEVDAVNIDTLLREYSFTSAPPLIKLDIEGAEMAVIPDMLSKCIYPSQILVEFDELAAPSKKSQMGVQRCHDALISANYKLIYREKWNFLYVRVDLR